MFQCLQKLVLRQSLKIADSLFFFSYYIISEAFWKCSKNKCVKAALTHLKSYLSCDTFGMDKINNTA